MNEVPRCKVNAGGHGSFRVDHRDYIYVPSIQVCNIYSSIIPAMISYSMHACVALQDIGQSIAHFAIVSFLSLLVGVAQGLLAYVLSPV